MIFEHTITVDAPSDDVAAFLADVPKVAACVPGVEDVSLVGDDEYEGRLRVRLGPVGFSLTGQAQVQSDEDGTMRARGGGRDRRIGAGVDAAIEARVEPLGAGESEVRVTADVQFSGRLAELGQPLIRRKADAMVRDFARNMQAAFSSA